MREIKFRVWDKIGLKMHPVVGLNFDYKEVFTLRSENKPKENTCGCCDDRNDDLFEFNNIILQQFTGLKDKNGKDIFEGDLVKRDFDGDIGQVEIDEGVFTMSGDCQLPLWQESVEVIGNIFENPELI